MKSFFKCGLFIVGLIVMLSLSIFALEGSVIITNANKYLINEWKCNIGNARSINADMNFANNDMKYPFYPLGAAIDEDSQGNPILNQDDIYTGVPYALGLRDDADLFEDKLNSHLAGPAATATKEPILAGEIDRVHSSEFTGLDCSGFISNCLGFPDLRKNNSYTLWHPGTIHLKNDEYYLTDSISWEELCPGDILVKYESVPNNGKEKTDTVP